MYNPKNRPKRPAHLREGYVPPPNEDQLKRLMVENAELRADLASAKAGLEARKREIRNVDRLKEELAKARRQRNWARERVQQAQDREAKARQEALMCRETIKELRDENQLLYDRQAIRACA